WVAAPGDNFRPIPGSFRIARPGMADRLPARRPRNHALAAGPRNAPAWCVVVGSGDENLERFFLRLVRRGSGRKKELELNADLEFIDIDVANRIATVTLNRPPVNAQNRVFRENLVFAFEWLDASSDVSAVILTGAGHVFSAGADLHERDSIERQPGGFYTHNRITRDTFFVVRDCTKPVIAAINGPAIGAGYALAACCDILIASTEAWIQMPELDRGLAGGAKFLQMHFSRSRSRLLYFTGRKIDAEEMYRLGIIDEVVAPEELMGTARGIAEEIVRK